MRYWDSSGLVPLFVEQRSSPPVRRLYAEDPMVLSWTLSDLEVLSALLRLGREGAVKQEGVDTALSRFEDFWGEVHVLAVADAVKARARRLLRVHSLSAADSLQLAAALAAVHDDPRGLGFVSLDDRLCAAAGREGFKVLP